MKKKFEKPFIGTSIVEDTTILHSNTGDYSSVIEMVNPIVQFAADPELYVDAHNLYGQLIKILGSGFLIQKTDIIAKNKYTPPNDQSADYLTQKYFAHFNGRKYNKIITYLTITYPNTRGRFFTYNRAELIEFTHKVQKVLDTLHNGKVTARVLHVQEIESLHLRYMCFNFNDDHFSISNISANDTALRFGDKEMRILSLIDIDELNIPTHIRVQTTKRDYGKRFPVDNFSWLLQIPDIETVSYSQCIFIPDQMKIKHELEAKKKRHTSMPDPANRISVDDIDSMFVDIAANNELLVYCNFSLLIYADKTAINKAANFVETNLFSMGIIPGKNTYNQMELFRASIPGNGNELKKYDKFLTSRPAAVCFIFNERLPLSEDSDYLLFFTDRQGIPQGIDTSERPMQTNRINNRNKFILGPSGTGKSFFTNSYVRQCHQRGADIVLVDTGHSYLGTCRYFKGKYITYKETKPITMNPFKIELVEYNEEKKQMLKSLIGLCWKGNHGTLNQVEDTILSGVISNYYRDYFETKQTVTSLSFNTFYEYSCHQIQEIIEKEKIKFDLNEFGFILKKFYQGGEYETILNDDFDNTLFNERFIVFEIDSIKEHKLLFPITTLIIMDVFVQKMRFKSNKKILVIEEAWKAIASPMMASYILYLYKTVRKHDGEAIVVTQELGDIIGNEIVKDSIIANSDTICLLDQNKFRENYDQIEKLLSLSEIEKNKIFTINKLDNKSGRTRFKEVYIRRGSVGEVYGVEVPIEEYLTYSTERSERELLEQYIATYRDYEASMERLVSDFKRSGLDLAHFVKMKKNKDLTIAAP